MTVRTLANSIYARAVILGIAYWISVIVSIELVSPINKIALFWPPNAIAATALILSSRKHWPLYLTAMALAYFFARMPSGHFPIYVYVSFCAANIIEVLIVAGMVKRFTHGPVTQENQTKVLSVAMLAAIPASLIGALISGVTITSAIEQATYWNASIGWFTGDLSGLLLVLPLMLTWLTPGLPSIKSYTKGLFIERVVIAVVYIAIGILTPIYLADQSHISLVFPYLVFPILIWTAMRLGLRSTSIAIFGVGMAAITMTYMGHSPFRIEGLSAFEQVVLMKVGLITITLSTVFLSVIVLDRKRVQKKLDEARSELESRVEMRTAELLKSEDRLRKIFETSPLGIAIVSTTTNKRHYINPAMAELFGADSVDQLYEHGLGQTYVNPDELKFIRSRTGADFVSEIEIERVRLNGERWWCLLNRRQIEYEGDDAIIAWHYDITERKHGEEEIKRINRGLEKRVTDRTRELLESETRFKGFATATADRFWETDRDHQHTFMSVPNARLFLPVGKMIGKPHWEVENRVPHTETWEYLRETMDAHDPFRDFIFSGNDANGTKTHVSLSGRPFFNGPGEFKGYRGSVTDITDLINRELALQESEARFSAAFHNSPALFTITTPEPESGQFIDVSDSWLNVMGYSRDEVIGKTTDELNIWIDENNRAKLINSIGKKGTVSNFMGGVRTRSGEIREFLISGDFIDIGGKHHLLLVAQDVTDQKRSEQALNQFKSTLDQTQDCVFMFDPETLRFFYVNQGAKKQLGYSEAELLKMAPYDIKPLFTEAEFRELMAPLIKGPSRSKRFETLHRGKDGTDVPVEVFIQYLKPKDEAPRCVAIVRDITERKRAEHKIRMAYDELEVRIEDRTHELAEEIEEHKRTEKELVQSRVHAEKASRAKSEFLSSMSHELRTPLNAIIGFSDFIREEPYGPIGNSKYHEYVDNIHESGNHLLELINNVLDVSAIEAGKVEFNEENVNLEAVIEASIRLVTPNVEKKRLNLKYANGIELPSLFADELRVRQIIINLLSNAVKFTPNGGEVRVAGEVSEDDSLIIRISDTGVGMSSAEIEMAMEPFGRSDSAYIRGEEGTGLGLPLSKALMEQHGGILEIDSEAGVGTIVSLRFPADRTVRDTS